MSVSSQGQLSTQNVNKNKNVAKYIFFFSLQSYDTDREDLNVSMLNDYTGAALKLEASTYEESRVLKVAKLCSAVHCGNVDNPKGKTFILHLCNFLSTTFLLSSHFFKAPFFVQKFNFFFYRKLLHF